MTKKERKKERKKEKDSIMENRLSKNNMQKGVKAPLNTKFRYKKDKPFVLQK